MRVSGFSGLTGAPQLRNAILVSKRYAATGVAPHAQTQRLAYTVPTARRFRLSVVQLFAYREAVAAPVGLMTIRCLHTDSVPVDAVVPMGVSISNVVGGGNNVLAALVNDYEAGRVIAADTTDLSTGGTFQFDISFLGMLYDA